MKSLKLNPSNAYFYAVINWYLKVIAEDSNYNTDFYKSIIVYIRLFSNYSENWLDNCSYCTLYKNNSKSHSCTFNGGCPLKPNNISYGCNNYTPYFTWYYRKSYNNAKAVLFQIFDTCPKVKLTKRQDEIVNEIKRLYNYENKT